VRCLSAKRVVSSAVSAQSTTLYQDQHGAAYRLCNTRPLPSALAEVGTSKCLRISVKTRRLDSVASCVVLSIIRVRVCLRLPSTSSTLCNKDFRLLQRSAKLDRCTCSASSCFRCSTIESCSRQCEHYSRLLRSSGQGETIPSLLGI
jgi:hypothetical protein